MNSAEIMGSDYSVILGNNYSKQLQQAQSFWRTKAPSSSVG
jgi:uncharacterized membrane protein